MFNTSIISCKLKNKSKQSANSIHLYYSNIFYLPLPFHSHDPCHSSPKGGDTAQLQGVLYAFQWTVVLESLEWSSGDTPGHWFLSLSFLPWTLATFLSGHLLFFFSIQVYFLSWHNNYIFRKQIWLCSNLLYYSFLFSFIYSSKNYQIFIYS